MVSPNVALKVMQYYQLAMFIGMCFFPAQMLDGYQIQPLKRSPRMVSLALARKRPPATRRARP